VSIDYDAEDGDLFCNRIIGNSVITAWFEGLGLLLNGGM
jgi:hypothetical protein